jgi:hypothetical protein
VHRLELGDGATTFDLVNTPSTPPGNIIDYIQGKIPGLQIYIGPDHTVYVFNYHGISNLNPKASPPFFYIDEARVDLQDILSLPIQDVALIRFAPPPAWFAPGGGGINGALLVYTRMWGDDRGGNGKRSLDRYTFNGYSVTREFPLPDYSITKLMQAADYRTTLYWKHDVDMDENGNFKIRFYNSDKARKYRVIVQGMDAEGRVGYLSEEF